MTKQILRAEELGVAHIGVPVRLASAAPEIPALLLVSVEHYGFLKDIPTLRNPFPGMLPPHHRKVKIMMDGARTGVLEPGELVEVYP